MEMVSARLNVRFGLRLHFCCKPAQNPRVLQQTALIGSAVSRNAAMPNQANGSAQIVLVTLMQK